MDPDQDRLDIELVRRVGLRDQSAFREIYERYQGAAYGLALRVTGQSALAQEVVHDAYLALWRAPEAFDPGRGAFRTFFLALVHHRAVDTVRREERLRRRSGSVNLREEPVEDVAEGVVDDAWLSIRRKQVRQALLTLPEEQRSVLELAYYRGMTQVQIAEALRVPLGTVKTRTFAALGKLRRALAEDD